MPFLNFAEERLQELVKVSEVPAAGIVARWLYEEWVDLLWEDDARRDIIAFIEGFYNRQRLYQSLGYLRPLEFKLRSGES